MHGQPWLFSAKQLPLRSEHQQPHGYQAIGTPGRALLEGAVEMKLFGETVQVAAEICKMPGISGHADVNGLIEWYFWDSTDCVSDDV